MANAKWMALIITLLLAPFLASNAQASSSGEDWPMFHYDPAHTGASNNSAPANPTELWTIGFQGHNGPVRGAEIRVTSAAVANGIVYFVFGSGSSNSTLYAYNASTGQLLWAQKDGNLPLAPIVEDGVVFSSSGAWNASTGTELWSSNDAEIVAAADGFCYATYVDPAWESGIANAFWLIGLNASTGTQVWNYSTGDIAYAPAVAKGCVYFATFQNFTALNAYTGEKLWDFEAGGWATSDWINSSPAVANNRVYFSSRDRNLYCFDALTGTEIWNFTGKYPFSSPSIVNGYIYVSSLPDGYIYAFNAETGAKAWNHKIAVDTSPYGVESSPVVASGVVYVAANDGYLYAFNAATGNILWTYRLGEPQHIVCSPAIANGFIYISTEETLLIALKSNIGLFSLDWIKIGILVFMVAVLVVVVTVVVRTLRAKSKA